MGLILGGATLGWAIEALVIPLAYEAPPLSFAWPSLGLAPRGGLWPRLGGAWAHAVGGGRRAWQGLAYLALGVIWTGWARLFWVEDPELVLPDVAVSRVYTVVTTALYGIGAWIVDRPGLHMTATGGDRDRRGGDGRAVVRDDGLVLSGPGRWPSGGLWGLTLLALRRKPARCPGRRWTRRRLRGAYLASLAAADRGRRELCPLGRTRRRACPSSSSCR